MAEVNNEKLELHEVERPRDLYEDAMRLGYEKIDLQDELEGVSDAGFEANSPQAQKLTVEIKLLDQQIDSLAQQWAEAKVLDIVNDPDRRAARVAARKEHFLKRLTRKMKRNERRLDRFEEDTEDDQRKLDRRIDRWKRREDRIDARQEAHRARIETMKNPRRAARVEAREERQDARQERRMERRMDRLERRTDRVNDHRDENTVVYDKAGLGEPGAPINSQFPTYDSRGDQLAAGADRDARFYGDNPEALSLSASADQTDTDLMRSLLSQDLRLEDLSSGTPASFRVIDIVYANDQETAAYYKDALTNGDTMERQQVIQELSQRQSELSHVYTTLETSELARRQVEKSSLQDTIWDKFTGLIGEVGRNPGAMAAIATLGVAMYLLRDEIPFKTVGKVVGGIALVGAGIYTTDFFWEKLDKEHRGLFDRLGFKPSDAMDPAILDKYRKEYFPRLPQEQRDSIDEMITLFNVPMSRVTDSFERAQANLETSIDTSTFLGEGVSSRGESHMDGTDLYRGLRWLYMDCADRYLATHPNEKPRDEREKIQIGLRYAKDPRFASMTFAEFNAEMHVMPQIRRAEAASRAPGAVEKPRVFSRDLAYPASLKGLAEKVPSARTMLRALPTGEVLVQGYPYRVNVSDQGKYVFTDLFDASRVYVISTSLQPGETEGLLQNLVSASNAAIEEKFKSFKGEMNVNLVSGANGEWTVEPALTSLKHAGLDTGSKGITTLFYADASGFKLTFNEAEKGQSFASLEAVQKAYDLTVALPKVVKRDAGHLLLNVPFEVSSVSDDAATQSTQIRIAYDGGHEGVLTYTKGVLIKAELAESVALDTAWDHEAKKQTVELFARPVIQDQIVAKVGVDPDVYVRWHNTVTGGLISREPNIPFAAGLFGTAGKSFSDMVFSLVNSNDLTGNTVEARQKDETMKEVDSQLGDLVVKMNEELKTLLSKGLPALEYKRQQESLMKGYETQIATILSVEVDPVLTSEEVDRMKKEADSQIEEALAPMKHTLSLDGNQSALYEERLHFWQQEAASGIDDAFATGSVTKSTVEGIIADVRQKASADATPHRGLDAEASATLISMDKLTGAHKADWKPATELALSYLSNNYKWEQYAVLGKRENMKDLVDLYFAKIENGNAAATSAEASDYVEHYFLPVIYMELGGNDDFSMDRFYARLNAVSDTEYQAVRSKLLSMKSFTAWKAAPEKFNVAPELDDAYRGEQEKQMVIDGFMDEFDKHLQVGSLDPSKDQFWDHKWPEYWRASVERRANEILIYHQGEPGFTTEQFKEELKDFHKFLGIEKGVFSLLIQHRIEPKDRGYSIESIVDENFSTHWYHRDYIGYYNEFRYKISRPDQDWWPELYDSVIEEAHDGYGVEKLFNVPFL